MRTDKPKYGLLRLCRAAADLSAGMLDLGYSEAQAMTVVRLYTLSCLAPRTAPPIAYLEPTTMPEPWPYDED